MSKSFLVDLMKLPNNIIGIHWARKLLFVLKSALLPLSNSNKLNNIRGPNLIVNYVFLVNVGMRRDLAPTSRTLLERIQLLSTKYSPPKLCVQICIIEKVMNDATLFTPKNKNDRLNITVQRNFANMMISELTEDNADNNRSFINGGTMADTICFRLGNEFDLNSTYIGYGNINIIEYKYKCNRNRIPYHRYRYTNGYDFHLNHKNQIY